jgi:triosephosphate isomerase
MKKKYIIAGNWKMHKTVKETIDFVEGLDEKISALPQNEAVEILVCPPFTSLYAITGKSDKIKTGAQNLHFEEKGAFTGEISPLMLAGLVDYVLIGHSERRQIFKETNEDINRKIKTALHHVFHPILCIGETLDQREAGQTLSTIQTQLDQDLEGLSAEEIKKVVIAYEPVWAIGTGKTASPQQAQEAHAFIRKILKKKIDSPGAGVDTRILYGGSVKATNSYDLLSQKDVNGALIGGASLKINDFFAIIQDAYKLADG